MKITYKGNLLIGFGVSLLILLLSSVASYVSIQNLLKNSGLVNQTNEVIFEMEQVVASLVDAESGQRGYLLTQDVRYLEYYEVAQRRAVTSIERVKELTLDDPIQQKSIADLQSVVASRVAVLQQVIDVWESTDKLDTGHLDTGKGYMDMVRSRVSEIEGRAKVQLANRTGKQKQFATYTPLLIIVASLIAIFITSLFYLRINTDLTRRMSLQRELQAKDEETRKRIDVIKNMTDDIARGDYSVRLSDTTTDALGSVAASLNVMVDSLEGSFNLLSEKEWLQAGVASLNEVIIGEDDINKLSQNILDFVCTYINGHAGALYLLEQGQLHLHAGYAYVAEQSRSSFSLGDGLIGQAVASGSIKELKNISAHQISIKFTTGEAHPKHVIALPVYDGRTPKGGLEIASLDTFSPHHLEFIKHSVHSIGVAISAAQSRARLQELLEETQSQAEELQAQHRELESVNSDLEIKTERLQASEEELRVQQEELRQANQELEEHSQLLEDRNQLITERTIEVQNKAEELAQSARYKSEFLANMSHELRTPLNSILLLSRLMSENMEGNLTGDQVEYASVIETSGKGLLLLIDEILDLSKIESGKMSLDLNLESVQGIVKDMESMFTLVANEKGLEFVTSIAPDVPEEIHTDKMRLEQIIRNLISNALKFTAQGHVSLSFAGDKSDASVLNITVKDTGIGVPPEKQQLIFEAFQQADGSTQRKYGGTGLGLSISRELVKLLGGEIAVSSEIGIGSEFVIRLPLNGPADISSQQQPDNILPEQMPAEVTQASNVDRKYLSTVIPDAIPDDRDQISAQDKVILIIEDDVSFAKSLLEYTRKQGYKGVVGVRGDEAIDLARSFSPLGILLDIQLPVKSGWEVMEELKSDPQTRHIPVHVMSSHSVKKESLLKGAVDFIDKPVAFDRMQDIFKKIEYVLTHHPKKVLIVEENSRHALALSHFLKTFDIKLEVNNGVDDAITSLKRNDVDCVVLDMGIPDQHSYDMLEEIKRLPEFESLPIIVFTGKSLSRSEEVRIKKYADSIVVKTAHSYKRILDEVALFLHLVEGGDPVKRKINKSGSLDDLLNGKTILIADDDVRNIFSLTKAMENYNVNVVTAIDGKDALKQLDKHPRVDVVLMDMMMPEMDGYQSTAEIRKDPRFKNLPIIAVTAKAMMGDREKCINAGASDYITKPVDFDQLLSLLRVWLYERG